MNPRTLLILGVLSLFSVSCAGLTGGAPAKGLVLTSWDCSKGPARNDFLGGSTSTVAVRGSLKNDGGTATDLGVIVEWLSSDGVKLGSADLSTSPNPFAFGSPKKKNLVVGDSLSFDQTFPRYRGVSLCRFALVKVRQPTDEELRKGNIFMMDSIKFSLGEGVNNPFVLPSLGGES